MNVLSLFDGMSFLDIDITSNCYISLMMWRGFLAGSMEKLTKYIIENEVT